MEKNSRFHSPLLCPFSAIPTRNMPKKEEEEMGLLCRNALRSQLPLSRARTQIYFLMHAFQKQGFDRFLKRELGLAIFWGGIGRLQGATAQDRNDKTLS